jgi:hypothetical protein
MAPGKGIRKGNVECGNGIGKKDENQEINRIEGK